MIQFGYDGPHAMALRDALGRGAFTSLFVQSLTGEWPGIGRSGHHVWGDAALAAAYELACRQFLPGEPMLAGACKRGARLAAESVSRWRRKAGDLFIVRNRFEPDERHGFESYSNHINYNLWTAAALAVALLVTDDSVPQRPLPAEVGSYVLELGDGFHHVAAGSRGTHLSVDTLGAPASCPPGLMCVSRNGFDPQAGRFDGSVAAPRYSGQGPRGFLSFAPSWRDRRGRWHRLATLSASDDRVTRKPELEQLESSAGTLVFRLRWSQLSEGCDSVTATFCLDVWGVEVCYEALGAISGLRAEFPILHTDGRTVSRIEADATTLSSIFNDTRLSICLLSPSAHLILTDQDFVCRTGLIRLAYAEIEAPCIRFSISLSRGSPNGTAPQRSKR